MSQVMTETVDDAKARRAALVLQQLDQLPTLPAVAVRLLNLTGNNDSRIREVTELVALDPSLTSRVLALVNSAGNALKAPVASVQQAIVMMGFEALRNLVLSLKVFDLFQASDVNDGGPGFDCQEFWKHSLAVATASELIAQRMPSRVSPHDAFTCGLLHDLGKVAFYTAMPKSFDRVVEIATLTRGDIADAERRVIGLDHTVAGKRIAEGWNLPAIITQTIWLHGNTPVRMPAGVVNPILIQLVGLADLIARRQHIGFSGNFLFPFDTRHYLQQLGLNETDLQAVTSVLTERLEAKAKALGLDDVESRQIYLESIANANMELGRVNQLLGTQNRKLQTRSECFDLLTAFDQRILPASTAGQIMQEIAHAAAPFLKSPRLAVFAMDANEAVGEVMTYDSARNEHHSFLMPMPANAGDHRGPRGVQANDFVRPAAPQLDWLIEKIGEFLGSARAMWMPLISGSELVGGVVWPASENARNPGDVADLPLVSQHWGAVMRQAQSREQQNVLTEALAAANRELASLQEMMVREKSLREVGEMAAGAAHEMNNPLAVMCGRAQLLASRLTDPALKQDATLIADQGQRLSGMITDLMAFAKPTPPKKAAVEFSTIAEAAIATAIERFGNASVGLIESDVAPHLPALFADARQMSDALAEILINALQATAQHGEQTPVLLQARHDPLDHRVIVQITDHGIGMDEATARQAFAPFFSAQHAGRRRGMGLAKALRTVEAHGGMIRLDSAAGIGTTAVILLPVE
jgi:putative nucleotidyltransferase with HDIG domain